MNRSANEWRDQSAGQLRLKGKIETGDYDVFLCYNSEDAGQVKAIADRLRERGILPWFDLYEVRPGARWKPALDQALSTFQAAVVFLGPKGPGPWQELETEAVLQKMMHRERPVIPVILPGRPGVPRLPAFLSLDAVDFREADPDPFERLVDGITR